MSRVDVEYDIDCEGKGGGYLSDFSALRLHMLCYEMIRYTMI
jgi:hypothetical protein